MVENEFSDFSDTKKGSLSGCYLEAGGVGGGEAMTGVSATAPRYAGSSEEGGSSPLAKSFSVKSSLSENAVISS